MPRKDDIGILKRGVTAGDYTYNKAFKQAVAQAYDFQYDDPRFHMALKMARDLVASANPDLSLVLHYFDGNLALILCCEEYHKQADQDYSNLLEGNRG